MFTKKDLNTGDFVVYTDGEVRMVLLNTHVGDVFVGEKSGYAYLSEFRSDLTGIRMSIDKVYRPRGVSGFTFDEYFAGDVIFDRNKEATMTIKEIEERLGITNLKIIKERF